MLWKWPESVTDAVELAAVIVLFVVDLLCARTKITAAIYTATIVPTTNKLTT